MSLVAFFLPGQELPSGPPVSDKLEHAAIFLLLTLAGRYGGFAAARLAGGLLAYAVTSEVLQAVLPIHRDGDVRDVLADALGIGIGLLLIAVAGWLLRTARPADRRRGRPPG